MTNSSYELTPDEYSAIGRISVHISDLERALILFISELVGDNPYVGLAVTAGCTANTLINMLRALWSVRLSENKYTDDFDALLSSLVKLADYRNRIIHSYWRYDPAEKKPIRTRLKRHKKIGFQIEHQHVNVDELNEFSNLVILATKTVHALSRRVSILIH